LLGCANPPIVPQKKTRRFIFSFSESCALRMFSVNFIVIREDDIAKCSKWIAER